MFVIVTHAIDQENNQQQRRCFVVNSVVFVDEMKQRHQRRGQFKVDVHQHLFKKECLGCHLMAV
jgi:hypothetical protein